MPAPVYDAPVDAMTPPRSRSRLTWREWRDLIGLALLAVGVVGLAVTGLIAAWRWDALAFYALLSALIVAAGLALGYDW